jgi:hypothetical protein
VNAFAVVVALAAVAALGWALTAVARRILRRYGVETDERSEDDEGRTLAREGSGASPEEAALLVTPKACGPGLGGEQGHQTGEDHDDRDPPAAWMQ